MVLDATDLREQQEIEARLASQLRMSAGLDAHRFGHRVVLPTSGGPSPVWPIQQQQPMYNPQYNQDVRYQHQPSSFVTRPPQASSSPLFPQSLPPSPFPLPPPRPAAAVQAYARKGHTPGRSEGGQPSPQLVISPTSGRGHTQRRSEGGQPSPQPIFSPSSGGPSPVRPIQQPMQQPMYNPQRYQDARYQKQVPQYVEPNAANHLNNEQEALEDLEWRKQLEWQQQQEWKQKTVQHDWQPDLAVAPSESESIPVFYATVPDIENENEYALGSHNLFASINSQTPNNLYASNTSIDPRTLPQANVLVNGINSTKQGHRVNLVAAAADPQSRSPRTYYDEFQPILQQKQKNGDVDNNYQGQVEFESDYDNQDLSELETQLANKAEAWAALNNDDDDQEDRVHLVRASPVHALRFAK